MSDLENTDNATSVTLYFRLASQLLKCVHNKMQKRCFPSFCSFERCRARTAIALCWTINNNANQNVVYYNSVLLVVTIRYSTSSVQSRG